MWLSPKEGFENHAIFKMSSVIGLFPFMSNKGILKVDITQMAYSSVFAAAVTTMGFVGIYQYLMTYKGEIYNQAVLAACLGSYVLIYPSHLLKMFLERRNVVEAIQTLLDAQSTFKRNIPTKTLLMQFLDISIAIKICISVMFAITTYSFRLYGCLSVSALSLVSGQFSFLTDMLANLLDAASDSLRKMRQSPVPDRDRKVEQVIRSANRLMSTAVLLEGIYSLQILFSMVICFSGFCVYVYRAIVVITQPRHKARRYLSSQIWLVSVLFYTVWKITHSSASASNKSKEFNTALYQLMIEDTTKEMLNNKMLRLHISKKREVVFTACGFFTLDYTLLKSIIASATTYLVILVQFGEPAGLSEGQIGLTNLTTSFPSTPAALSEGQIGLTNLTTSVPSTPAGLSEGQIGVTNLTTSFPSTPAALSEGQIGLTNLTTSVPSTPAGLSEGQIGVTNLTTSFPSTPAGLSEGQIGVTNLTTSFPSTPVGLSEGQIGLTNLTTSVPSTLPTIT